MNKTNANLLKNAAFLCNLNKKHLVFSIFLVFFSVNIFSQQNTSAPQKFALVIGNSNYTGISRLTNPVNDANDMEITLINLGFSVDKVLNGSLDQMETAILDFKRKLGSSRNSYGFFFFAGHGVQSSGENYLIPVIADNIRSETQLRDRAVSLQFVLDSMNEAGNELNIVILDACRDNPFGWARSGSRGLGVVSRTPTGSIVMYATGANSTADDGTGRNGLFTSHLLNNLRTPGLSVFDVFDRTMGDVIRTTNGRQHPELSLRFAGATSAFLGTRPTPVAAAPTPTPAPMPAAAPAVTPPTRTAAPEAAPIARPTPMLPFNISDVLTQSMGWFIDTAAGNHAVLTSTEVNIKFNKEVIGGKEVDVMEVTVEFPRANVYRYGAAAIGLGQNEALFQRLRNANGVRFSVLGDGGRGWRININTQSTDLFPHHLTFNPSKGKIVNVDVPFSKLKQPSWVSQNQRVSLDRRQINGLTFTRWAASNNSFSGPSTIKIFNFEIY